MNLSALQLYAIVEAADDLDSYLSHNSGNTADWPLRLVVDNKDDATKLAALLTDLKKSLVPYREQFNLSVDENISKEGSSD